MLSKEIGGNITQKEETQLRQLLTEDSRKKKQKEILLHPNQKIVMRNNPILPDNSSFFVRDLIVVNDTIIPETQWLEGSLVFRKQRFSDLGKLMEKRYRVTIKIENATLAGQYFTGSIKSETVLSIHLRNKRQRSDYPFRQKAMNRSSAI